MKIKTRFVFFLAMGMCLAFNLVAQKPEGLVGTWAGPATLEGMGGSNEFVLVMELKEGNLTGHLTDQFGTASETPIDKIKLENGVFSFSVVGRGPGGEEITLLLKMNIDGESMEGTLEIEEMGMTGTWEATKQK
jgi:hypothetical protein